LQAALLASNDSADAAAYAKIEAAYVSLIHSEDLIEGVMPKLKTGCPLSSADEESRSRQHIKRRRNRASQNFLSRSKSTLLLNI
jgi:hypothetical protein